MRIKYQFLSVISILLIFLMLMSCDSSTTEKIPDVIKVEIGDKPEEDYTEQGWIEFENSKYLNAIKNFKLAISENNLYQDAYNGLGWSYARVDSMSSALKSFTIAINSSPGNQEITKDAIAGRSFVNLVLNKYNDAILDVNQVLNYDSYGSNSYKKYVFRHDLNITDRDLNLVKAISYFMTAQYDKCYQSIILIDSTAFSQATYDPEKLAEIIERLKRSI
jgi:tetratricopeptide (TPR) repeat protein